MAAILSKNILGVPAKKAGGLFIAIRHCGQEALC
jgi:hypothetical protein